MKICVIGSGYVGLVTGACLSDFGNIVVCIDKDKKKTVDLKKGIIDFHELGLSEMVKRNVRSQRLFFSAKPTGHILSSQVIFIAVGTPPLPDGEADLSGIKSVARTIGKELKKLKINDIKAVVVKSTVPVGTSEMVEQTILSQGARRRNFEVVSNPEFLREGKAVSDFLHPDRIVIGASGKEICNIMAELYRPLNARIIFMDHRSSELVKYASNVFLANRISMINEIANICGLVDADIRKVVEGLGHDERIGHSYLKPGIGYGGSCLPKDISALIHLAEKHGYDPIVLKGIHQRNINQREHFAKKVIGIVRGIKGTTVAVWGLAFKPQTDDLRDAPSIAIIRQLLKEGIEVKAYDPMANEKARNIIPEIEYCSSPYEAAIGSDALVIITEWNEFREIDFVKLKKILKKPIIIDGRNIFNPENLKEHGLQHYGIGIKNKAGKA